MRSVSFFPGSHPGRKRASLIAARREDWKGEGGGRSGFTMEQRGKGKHKGGKMGRDDTKKMVKSVARCRATIGVTADK